MTEPTTVPMTSEGWYDHEPSATAIGRRTGWGRWDPVSDAKPPANALQIGDAASRCRRGPGGSDAG